MRLWVILVLLFVLYLAVKVLIGFTYLSSQRRKRREELGGEMVRDPVCETYIPRSRSIEKNLSGQIIYFCSQECMNAFFEKRRAS
jgi:YHS domain-containing protein